MGRKLRGERKFALTLTLDPLGGLSNGNGAETKGGPLSATRPMLSVAQCLTAIQECNTPIIFVSGGEPLEYPEIAPLVRSILRMANTCFCAPMER